MNIFSPLYTLAMQWARHRRAPWFLGAMSFAESSFFPIPPDVMLAPMSMAAPRRAMFYALITTLTSVAGGLFGSLRFDTPSGPSIVVAALAIFVVSLVPFGRLDRAAAQGDVQ